MAEWQSGDVVVNGLRLHYTRTGGDLPAVVLAHGFSDDGLCWTPVAQLLAADYDVVMVDARCHGQSDGPETPYGTQDMGDDLAGVIRGLGLDHPVVMGHSMGGATAYALAGTYPELPRAIIIEDSGALNMGAAGPDYAEWLAQRRRSLVELKRKTREQLIADEHAASPLWSDAELGPWADSKLRLSLNVLNRLGTPVDWQAVMTKITCPALLITADTDRGSMVSAEHAAELQQLIPQLRVKHLPGAGHNIRREQFGPYMETVRGFLAEVHATPVA